METIWFWWILAIAVVALELLTGTVYLLMLAVGLFAGGVAAWIGAPLTWQLLTASGISGLGCWWVYRRKLGRTNQPQTTHNANVHIDVGNTVSVTEWSEAGASTVHYRGAQWQVKLANGSSIGIAGQHRIIAIEGSTLVVERI